MLNKHENPSDTSKSKHIIQKCLGDMRTDVIGGPHDFLSDRSDEFQKLWVLIYWLKLQLAAQMLHSVQCIQISKLTYRLWQCNMLKLLVAWQKKKCRNFLEYYTIHKFQFKY
jgi:hypothetical protein